MSKFTDNIKKIARSAEIEAKIKVIPPKTDKANIPSERGIGTKVADPGEDVCALFYSQAPNSYDIGDLLAGTAGPTLSDGCSRLDTITGLTDVDVSEEVATEGATVLLVIQTDGIFT
jgi:hypothetical protein